MSEKYNIQNKIDEFYHRKCLEDQKYSNMTKKEVLTEFNLFNCFYYTTKYFSRISEIARICDVLNLTLQDLKEDCEKLNSSKNENVGSSNK
jgi:hypothetical protein